MALCPMHGGMAESGAWELHRLDVVFGPCSRTQRDIAHIFLLGTIITSMT